MAARSAYLGQDLLDSDDEEAGNQHTRPRRAQSQNCNVGTQPAQHETNGMSVGERRFVLALDFGTTFTGVAFASVEAKATNYPHSSKIEVVRNWGRSMGNMDKVPSVISYSFPGEPEWGSNISGDALTLINQKLELELPEKRVDELGLTKEMKQLMDRCVNPAVALVRAQIEAMGSYRGTEVKTVFLVGGFGASPYLQEELRSSFELMDVTVFHPPKDSLTAVVQGAVIHGIERPQGNRTVTMTSMTKTYGYVENSYNLRWFIRTGDLIMRGSPAIWETDDFWMIPPSSEHSSITFRLSRFDTGDDNINQRLPINWKKSWNDVEVAGIVKVPRGDLTRGPMAGSRQLRLFGPFMWRVTCNDTDLFAQLLLNGSVLGTCYKIATERKEYNKKPSGGPYDPAVVLNDVKRVQSQSATRRRTLKPPRPVRAVNRERLRRAEPEWSQYDNDNPLKNTASSQSVCRLRSLIREKYALDVEVWDKRDVQQAVRPYLMEKARRSGEILREILNIVSAWDERDFESAEWMLALQIKSTLLPASKHQFWEKSPPWTRESFDEDD
ncbi:hypothetical protein CBER1_05919 [Cercospora berteroae]|uniref:Uncharacterized protein n=1 Tax=Cercospora berteroae TaxID=357750 RepID=A0A2S6BS84_9PEZI|nr:hypothetical protein CBER1_05919 [Cercospora berteroae]